MAEPAEYLGSAAARTETITLGGHVQGVGFRPFVYRLALAHCIHGWVRNRLGEVEILATGSPGDLDAFRRDLVASAPPLSRPAIIAVEPAAQATSIRFEILPSEASATARIFVPPDYFMCDDCMRELHDPADRRYRYPFINCTQCGPRYTLIRSLPYDRPNTSMADFPLCADCEREYTDPANRRFHAEPVACPDCGPSVWFETRASESALRGEAALEAALRCLRDGRILAVKGVGGYHLLCDAENDDAVLRLRQRKQRPGKPLAVMFPLTGNDGLGAVSAEVELEPAVAACLAGPERPIVLAPKRRGGNIAPSVAPGLAELGVFLPYSPLHELLLAAFGAPLVATSGNISGEPVLTDNRDAALRLSRVADAFLHHNRPIVRPADDSVYRSIAGRVRQLRTGRGAAPRELSLDARLVQPTLAVGGHMKGTVALAWDDRVVVSPHIGEMDSPKSLAVFEQVAAELQSLYGVTAERIVCDAHPGYTTHRWAMRQPLPATTVWHHHAHASALTGEHRASGTTLVFTWDGVGLGEDGELWGGEALLGAPGRWRRVASLRTFRLPGGERPGRQPWRSAAALAWEAGRPLAFECDPDGLARAAWEHNLNCPRSSSAGRLFDAAASLILGMDRVSYEAEGPMHIESLCRREREGPSLPVTRDAGGILRSDWAPLIDMLADDGLGASTRAAIFHDAMARIVIDQAMLLRETHGVRRVGLSGGVFQNRVLTELAVNKLKAQGFTVLLAEALPCNDAAISFGQAVEVAARDREMQVDG